MSLGDAFRRIQQAKSQESFGEVSGLDTEGFRPTQPGNPDFSLAETPGSQLQFPAASAEKGIHEVQTRAGNQLTAAQGAGQDITSPDFAPLQQAADEGFLNSALTLGERLVSWIDGPRQAVNLLIQDMVGGEAEEGMRNPDFGDYWNTLWGGMEDENGFKIATGLEPRSGSKTLDMFGWSEEEDWPGKIARGITDFVLQGLTDPLTYVTFGLSMLGKSAARAAGTKFMDDAVRLLGNAELDEVTGLYRYSANHMNMLKETNPYAYSLAREIEGGGPIISDLKDDFARMLTEHGGTFPPDVAAALKRQIGDPSKAMDNIVKLAVAKRVADDVIKPLVGKNFANINKDALLSLPKWAMGGARIAVPFTQSSLEKGFLIPGSQGLGRKLVGDPVRKVVGSMRGTRFEPIIDYIGEVDTLMGAEKAINRALASGRLSGWQYAIAKPGLDNISNQQVKESTVARLNQLGQNAIEAADAAGVDSAALWPKIMHNLEQADFAIDDVALGALNDILGPSLKEGEDALDKIIAGTAVDQAVQNLSVYLREVFDSYHNAIAMFDPALKKRYIDGYAPHATTDIGRVVLGKLSRLGKTISKAEWQKMQADGNPGGVMLAHMINAQGRGGRLEASLGASRHFDPREEGKLAVLALTDDGNLLIDKAKWGEWSGDGVNIMGPGGTVNTQALQTRYAPSSTMNGWLKPVVEKVYADNNLPLPKGWDGKIFSENPLELAVGYIQNLDDVVRMWNAVEGMKAAGLAFKHSTAPNVQQIMHNMMANVVRNTETVTKPTAPEVSPGMGPMYHGGRGPLPESLEAIEVTSGKGDSNLFSNAFYTTNTADIADTYRQTMVQKMESGLNHPKGTRNAVEWQGSSPPYIVDVDAVGIDPKFAAGISKFLDEFVPKDWEDAGNIRIFEDLGRFQEAADIVTYQKIRAIVSGKDRMASNKGAMSSLYQDVRELALGTDTADIGGRLNILLRDEGIDALRYQGGLRTKGKAHDAYAWLRPEKLKPMDVTDLPETVDQHVLKGYEDIMAPVPMSVARGLKDGGWDTADLVGNSKIYQISKLSTEDFLLLRDNPMKAGDALVDKATGGFQNLRRIRSDIPDLAVISKSKKGWSETNLRDDQVAYTFRDNVGKPRGDIIVTKGAKGVEVDFTVNPNMSPRQQLAFTREIMEKFDEIVTTGPLKGEFNYANIDRILKNTNMSDAGARVLHMYLKRKVFNLPKKAKEYVTKEASEFVDTRLLADDFLDEFNMFFKEYASIYDPGTGKLLVNEKKVTLAGDDVVRERIKSLREAAKKAGDAGWKTATDIMNRIDDPMGLAEVDDFVSPLRHALGGPAVNELTIHRDMALWLRSYARNVATAYTPEGISALKLGAKTQLRWWKAMATIARPSFHIRNHISASWANMTIGVRPKDYAMVRNNAITFKNALRDGKTPDEAFAALSAEARPYFKAAWDKEIMSGFVSSELRTLTAASRAERMAWAKVWDVDNFALTRAGGHVMESIEDFHRMAAFVRWYDPADPGSADLAKAMVERVHFNYANTTPLEDRIKAFVPFFVWTRRNIPLQIETLTENPRFIQRYRAMMQSMNDNFSEEENELPPGEQFSAYAAGTDIYVNKDTPFWARVMIDPDLPVHDLLDLPTPTPGNLVEFGNQLLGPHVSALLDVNAEREFGDVNAPAPLNMVLRSLAAVGLYDTTTDGDVRIPYYARSVMETIFPPSREIIDPLTGGPTDPNRQQRLGIKEDDSPLAAALKTLAGTLARGGGVKFNTPADIRSKASQSQQELDGIIEQLRLEGKLPPAEDTAPSSSIVDMVFG